MGFYWSYMLLLCIVQRRLEAGD